MYWRASASCRVSSASRRSGLSSGSGAGAPGDRSSDQRPAPTAPEPVRRFQRACQRARAPPRVCVAEISARRPEKPSPVTRPAETSSPSASSISARRRRVPAMISSRKLAPVRARNATASRAGGRQAVVVGRQARVGRQQPRKIGAPHERDRRRAAGRAAGGPGRQPPPRDAARKAERIQPRRIVADDARRKDRALPGAGRRFEALKVGDHARQARLAVELAARDGHAASRRGSAGGRRR